LFVLISIQNDREWAVLASDVLGHPEWVSDPRFATNIQRMANRSLLDPLVAEIFAQYSRDEMVAKLESAKIAYGRVSTMDDLVNHPQNRHIEVDTPSGPVRYLAPGAIFDNTLPELGRVPALGEHSAQLMAEFASK
jgi:crotonobetainyl-CoA:carnitine CoA-transferase CaiB-like acyl-CoA transferase